jgi:hypothetical protein
MTLPRRRVFGNQDNIPTAWYPAMRTHPFPYQTTDPVPHDGVSYLFGNRDPEATIEVKGRSSTRQREQVTTVHLGATFLNAKVV